MRTAIVHDWFVVPGGAEQCLVRIHELFPGDIFTLVAHQPTLEELGLPQDRVHASFLQGVPFVKKWYRSFLPLFPLAVEQFDVSDYDLVISSSHAVAKGVLVHPDQVHICYCYTPMRYAWDLHAQYLRESKLDRGVSGRIAQAILHYLRMWDRVSADRVDHFIAISKFVAARIGKVYRRDATVIYPPVDTDSFPMEADKEDYYVAVSRMVPYKRMDLIVRAFSSLPHRRLVVVGDGPDFEKVKKEAGSNVTLLGHASKQEVVRVMQKARALIFCAMEDFGMVPVEAMACGTPVIAYRGGGVLETVVEGETGFFFDRQDEESIVEAIHRLENTKDGPSPEACRRRAVLFHPERFRREFTCFVDRAIGNSDMRATSPATFPPGLNTNP
ncbi:MAG: glycosyltransferase [Candidatus Moduliflexus flocculans]|nr:glycosyltransferase [Candidatus Moduliflexus flocculans]